MSGYDVTEVDMAVSLALHLANRTEWRDDVHRYVLSDVRVEQLVADEYGVVDAGMAMAMLKAGRVRLLRAPLNRESSCYGKSIAYRDAVA